MDSDPDSKPDGYIVLCRTFHIAQAWTRHSLLPISVQDRNSNQSHGAVLLIAIHTEL